MAPHATPPKAQEVVFALHEVAATSSLEWLDEQSGRRSLRCATMYRTDHPNSA